MLSVSMKTFLPIRISGELVKALHIHIDISFEIITKQNIKHSKCVFLIAKYYPGIMFRGPVIYLLYDW